jgi:hypothetical protein
MAKRKISRRSRPANARVRKTSKPARAARPARKKGAGKTAKPARPSLRKKAPPKAAKAAVTTAVKRAGKVEKKAAKGDKKTVKRRVTVPKGKARKAPPAASARTAVAPATVKRPYLDRQRRTLEETVQTPPSSLDLDQHGSAARSGRAALSASLKQHTGMTPELTVGDVDANWENAYFSGEEAPGGDNPSPEENVVEDIGKALGVEYDDGETLQASDKITERDEHRWELDPASAEDYKDRK